MPSSSDLANTGFTLSWEDKTIGRNSFGTRYSAFTFHLPSGHKSIHDERRRRLKVSYQVDVAELVQPEVVDGRCDGWEVVGLEAGITETNSGTQSGQNPPV